MSSSISVNAPYATFQMEQPKAASKLPSAPATLANKQRQQSAIQQPPYKKQGSTRQQQKAVAATRGITKQTSGIETQCSSPLQSFEVTSTNFASTLRGNYVSAMDRKYRTGRPTPKAGQTQVGQQSGGLFAGLKEPMMVAQSRNDFPTTAKYSTSFSSSQIPHATYKSPKPIAEKEPGKNVSQSKNFEKAAKTPKGAHNKRTKQNYNFVPTFNVANRAVDRQLKLTNEPFSEQPKKSTIQQKYRTQKAQSPFIATTQGSSKISKKECFADKPQNISPISFPFNQPIHEKPGKAQQANLLRTICTARGLSSQNQILSPEKVPQNNMAHHIDNYQQQSKVSSLVSNLYNTSRNNRFDSAACGSTRKRDGTHIVEMERNFIEETPSEAYQSRSGSRQPSIYSHGSVSRNLQSENILNVLNERRESFQSGKVDGSWLLKRHESHNEFAIEDNRKKCHNDSLKGLNLLSYQQGDPLQSPYRKPKHERHKSMSEMPIAGLPASKLHVDNMKDQHMECREDPAKAKNLRSQSWHSQNFQSDKVRACLQKPDEHQLDDINFKEEMTPVTSANIVNYRNAYQTNREASATSRSSNVSGARQIKAKVDTGLYQKVPKLNFKLKLPQQPDSNFFQKRSSSIKIQKQVSQKNFTFSKPHDLFDHMPEFRTNRSKNTPERNKYTINVIKSSNNNSLKSFGVKSNENIAELHTPQQTARFREKSGDKEASKPQIQHAQKKKQIKDSRKEFVNKKKSKIQIDNKDSQKVNNNEDNIQNEALEQDWMHEGTVVNKAQNNKKKKSQINIATQRYQEKVITKNDLIRGHQTTSRSKVALNKVKKTNNKEVKRSVNKSINQEQFIQAKQEQLQKKEKPKKILETRDSSSINASNIDLDLLTQRNPITKNLSVQTYNLQKKQSEMVPALSSQRSNKSRNRQPKQKLGEHFHRSGEKQSERFNTFGSLRENDCTQSANSGPQHEPIPSEDEPSVLTPVEYMGRNSKVLEVSLVSSIQVLQDTRPSFPSSAEKIVNNLQPEATQLEEQ